MSNLIHDNLIVTRQRSTTLPTANQNDLDPKSTEAFNYFFQFIKKLHEHADDEYPMSSEGEEMPNGVNNDQRLSFENQDRIGGSGT